MPEPSSWLAGSGARRAYSEPRSSYSALKTTMPSRAGRGRDALATAEQDRDAHQPDPQAAERQQARRTTRQHGVEEFIQIGTVAMITAAMLDGMRCSAIDTRPLPPSSSSVPTMAAVRHSTSWSGGREEGRTCAGATGLRQQEGEQQAAGHRNRTPAGQERRQRLDHVRDGQVGGAPDDVDRPERHAARTGSTSGRGLRGIAVIVAEPGSRHGGGSRFRRPNRRHNERD